MLSPLQSDDGTACGSSAGQSPFRLWSASPPLPCFFSDPSVGSFSSASWQVLTQEKKVNNYLPVLWSELAHPCQMRSSWQGPQSQEGGAIAVLVGGDTFGCFTDSQLNALALLCGPCGQHPLRSGVFLSPERDCSCGRRRTLPWADQLRDVWRAVPFLLLPEFLQHQLCLKLFKLLCCSCCIWSVRSLSTSLGLVCWGNPVSWHTGRC